MKSKVPKQMNVRKYESFDPIPPVADLIVQETSILCFDEFQVRCVVSFAIWKSTLRYICQPIAHKMFTCFTIYKVEWCRKYL